MARARGLNGMLGTRADWTSCVSLLPQVVLCQVCALTTDISEASG